MDVLLPTTLAEALEIRSTRPDAVPIAGGTDLMVALNFDRKRPAAIIDLTRIPELRTWRAGDGTFFLGSGVTYARIVNGLPRFEPLVQASRSVGSPQIRNRGTVGGNLGTASPAGDALPVLAAYDAEVVLARAGGGTRALPWHRFMTGPKKTAMAPDELILGARWKVVRGPGSFSKVGMRNAMVIAIASLCLVLDEDGRTVRVALGSVGPTILRAPEAERLIAQAMASAGVWDDPRIPVSLAVSEEFAERVAAAAKPIDDVRGTAAYRRHACAVLAKRALSWALSDRKLRDQGPGTRDQTQRARLPGAGAGRRREPNRSVAPASRPRRWIQLREALNPPHPTLSPQMGGEGKVESPAACGRRAPLLRRSGPV
jgi:CO/xanthine dehydrogenase FAD-binding subunit